MRFRLSVLVIAAAASLVMAACGDSAAEPTTTAPPGPTLPPNAEAVLAAAAATMGTVDTVRFTIERGGAPVYIDPFDAVAFVSAEGRYQAPSAADAVLVAAVNDLSVQIGAVAIDGETWISNVVTGDWEKTPQGYAFDPATLFDPDLGWRPLLAGELTDAELVGLETRRGEELYHVRGKAGEDRIEVITAGLVQQDVVLDLWLHPRDGSVREVSFTTLYRGAESDWLLRFFDYGADITIEVPDFDGDA